MSIKAKLAAAVQRANEDRKKGKYKKTITPSPEKPYMKTITEPQTTFKEYNQKIESKKTVKRTPMSPMPTLKPTSVSVSVEKRTDAPLAGQKPMRKSRNRG